MRAFSILFVAAALCPLGEASGAQVTAVPGAEYQPALAPPKAEAKLLSSAVEARRIVLTAPTAAERAKLLEQRATTLPAKRQRQVIGFGRDLPAPSRRIVLAELAWQPLADGRRVARVEVNSPGAAALRIALSLIGEHPDLALKFKGSGPRAEVLGPYPANVIAATAQRDGQFWTPVLEGDTAAIELEAGAGATVAGLALVMGPLSHLVVAGADLAEVGYKRQSDIGSAGSCNIDVACVTPPSTTLTQAANSVGKTILTTRFGGTIACTGVLLNNSIGSFAPYLFTAAHCVDDAYVASTLNVYWFFRAQTCGSRAVPPYVLQIGGASLLARSDDFDWALLRLNLNPPPGTFFSAWRAERVPVFTIATGVHHPHGDLAKFSQGQSVGFQPQAGGATYLLMQWSQGTTEVGSSGSPLFTRAPFGDHYEVRGGLQGGDASCSNRAGLDTYSQLDTLLPLVREYLTPDADAGGRVVVVEFYNAALDHFFLTSDPIEIDLLDRGVLRGWLRTGVRFLAYGAPTAGANPVCRFYLRPGVGDSHFYSGDPAECELTLQKFGASWIYESPSVFYIALPDQATGACPFGTRPIWRFFNSATINHRYTPEVAIRNELRFDSRWIPEGYGPDGVIMCSVSDG